MSALLSIIVATALAATDDPTWVPTWDDAEVLAYYRKRPMRVLIDGSGHIVMEQQLRRELQVECTTDQDCMVTASKYTTFVFTAIPDGGAKWKGWSGGCIKAGMALTCRITNSEPHTVLAVFSNSKE